MCLDALEWHLDAAPRAPEPWDAWTQVHPRYLQSFLGGAGDDRAAQALRVTAAATALTR